MIIHIINKILYYQGGKSYFCLRLLLIIPYDSSILKQGGILLYLYRVLLGDIFSHLTPEQIKDIMFFPEIPHAIMKGENQDIERICLSESIEGCLTSIGWKRLDCAFQDYMNEDVEGLRIVILKFDINKLDKKYLRSPEELDEKKYVPDAYITREWWYELPAKADEVEIKYLYDYSMENTEYVLPKELRGKEELSEEEIERYIENGIEVPLIENLKWIENKELNAVI